MNYVILDKDNNIVSIDILTDLANKEFNFGLSAIIGNNTNYVIPFKTIFDPVIELMDLYRWKEFAGWISLLDVIHLYYLRDFFFTKVEGERIEYKTAIQQLDQIAEIKQKLQHYTGLISKFNTLGYTLEYRE